MTSLVGVGAVTAALAHHSKNARELPHWYCVAGVVGGVAGKASLKPKWTPSRNLFAFQQAFSNVGPPPSSLFSQQPFRWPVTDFCFRRCETGSKKNGSNVGCQLKFGLEKEIFFWTIGGFCSFFVFFL